VPPGAAPLPPAPAAAARSGRQTATFDEVQGTLLCPAGSECISSVPATKYANTDEADEVIDAIAKTVAELTCQQDAMIRQQLIEHLMREIIHYDAEFRREEAVTPTESHARH